MRANDENKANLNLCPTRNLQNQVRCHLLNPINFPFLLYPMLPYFRKIVAFGERRRNLPRRRPFVLLVRATRILQEYGAFVE